MANIGSLYAYIGADTTGLTMAQKNVSSFVTGTTAKFKSLAVVAGSVFGAMAGATMIASFTRGISLAKQYETALVDMGKVSDQTFAVMDKQIKGLNANLGDSTQLMRGYYAVVSAGVTEPTKALELLTVASKLGKAAHMDQATSVKSLAVMMGAYGDELKNVTQAANTMLSIERYGITTTAEVADKIGLVVNLAKQGGLSINEFGAALAQVTVAGIGTAESVTQLRALISSLIEKFDTMPAAIQKYSSASDAIKNMGFINVLQTIWSELEGNESAIIKLLGQKEAFLGMLQLLKSGGKEYEDRLTGMADKVGALDKAWEEYKNSLEGVWDTFKNLLINAIISFTSEILPALKTGLQFIINNFDLLVSSLKTVAALLKDAVYIYFASKILPLMIMGFRYLVAEIQLMNVRLALAPGLIGKLTTSLTGASTKINLLNNSVNLLFAAFAGWEIGKWLNDNFEEARLAGVLFVDKLMSGWNWLSHIIKVAIVSWKEWFKEWVYSAQKLYGEFLKFVANGMLQMPGLKGIGAGLFNYAETYLSGLKSPAGELAKTLSDLEKQYEVTKTTHTQIIDEMINDALNYGKVQGDIQKTINEGATVGGSAGGSGGNVKKVTIETLQAYRKMYEDLGYYGKEWHDNEVKLLKQQAEEYKTITGDKLASEKWLQDQIQKTKELGIDKQLFTVFGDIDELEKTYNEISNKEKQYNQDRLIAYKSMYDDMKEYSTRYYEFERELIKQQAEEYRNSGVDNEQVKVWEDYQNREVKKKELVDTGGFMGGVVSGMMEVEDAMKNSFARIGQFGKDSFTSIYQSFEDTIYNGLQGKFESISDIWENTWDTMKNNALRIFSQMLMEMAMQKLITPALEGLGSMGGGSWGGIASGVASFFGGMTGAANGGVFSGPSSGYPIMMHGNEAVIPLKDGKVPVEMSGQDKSTVINMYISTPDATSFKRSRAQITGDIKRALS